MDRFCSKCGKPIGEGDMFCGSCGKQLATNSDVPAGVKESKLPDSPLGHIVLSLRSYGIVKGRATRAEFWYFAAFYIIGALSLAFIGGFLTGLFSLTADLGSILYYTFTIMFLLPYVAVTVRRLHDTGRSGWWLFLSFVPFGGVVILIFMLTAGDEKANRYGTRHMA